MPGVNPVHYARLARDSIQTAASLVPVKFLRVVVVIVISRKPRGDHQRLMGQNQWTKTDTTPCGLIRPAGLTLIPTSCPRAVKEFHQSPDRKMSGTVAHQRGDMRLLDSEDFSSFCLCEVAFLDDAINLKRELGLNLVLLGIGQVKIGKDVATAFLLNLDFDRSSSCQSCLSLPCCRAMASRCLIRLMFFCGVEMPRCDFFWKACSTQSCVRKVRCVQLPGMYWCRGGQQFP